MLRAGEEIHRTFRTLRGVTVLQAVGRDGQLCAKQLRSDLASRKQYEDSWTGVSVAGGLEAVFNGSCFTRSPDVCVDYLECQEHGQRYPTDPNAHGRPRFAPESGALEGLRWASALAAVEAWQREQAALQAQLALSPDDSSEKAQYLRSALTAAAAAADGGIRTGADSLIAIAKQRVASFKQYVRPSTAPQPAPGSSDLPGSLEALAAAQEALVAAAENQPCNANHDWATLHGSARSHLGTHGSAIALLNASALLLAPDFDYAQRAVEAFAVGSSLALQVGALAALAEFTCQLQTSPRSAAVRDLSTLRQAAQALLGQVSSALPAPSDGLAPSAPLQLCFSDRMRAAASAVSSQAAADAGAARLLLSLDFCGRLFHASASVVIQVVPHTEAAPSASSMTFSSVSGEERRVHASVDGHFAYMSPYMDFVLRGTGDATAFAASDKVLQLTRIADDNVHAAGSLPTPNVCSGAQAVSLMTGGSVVCDSYNHTSPPCRVRGCFRSGGHCWLAKPGFYTDDGLNQKSCPRGNLTWDQAVFYAMAWHDSSCPFACQRADSYRSGTTCKAVLEGYYSPTCSNDHLPCSTPPGLPDGLFCSLARFTSPGRGSPRGCEARIASPLAAPAAANTLMPPLTAELWVKVSIGDLPSPHAVLMGTFPEWFVALRGASSSAVQIGFYHHLVTRTASSRQDSIVYSDPIPWSGAWRHIAVVVSSSDDTTPNVHFYSDGELVSSAQRSAVARPFPHVHHCQHHTFHVGAPNVMLSPEVTKDGRTEPYFPVSGPNELFYAAQIDEVRVSQAALDGLTQGARLTELRRRAACDAPFERLEGSTCRPRARLTPQHAGQEGCKVGFEMCGSRPGLCVAQCSRGTLRQPDCTCDCPPGKFQTWYAQALHLVGSGTVGNVTVYDTLHGVIAHLPSSNLPRRISISPAQEVALVTVRGIDSAKTLSLDVETATGTRMPVPAYRSVPLRTDRDAILHHRRLHDFFDPSLSCATCPGDLGVVLGSQLPRFDSMSCLCAAGYGRNLLGRCVQLKEPLPSPSIAPSPGFYTAGTRVRLQLPTFFGEGPWLLEVRYTAGTDASPPAVPTCRSSPRYSEDASGSPVGLDIIRRRTKASVCAVACHPMHQDSQQVCADFTGNEHMNPPRCTINGTLSTATTYALQVVVEVVVDGQPGASIHYRLAGSQQSQDYSGPLTFANPGATQLEVWADQPGFDQSAVATCRFAVDGAPRLGVALAWPEQSDPQKQRQLGGFVHSEGAFLVKRSVDKLRFKLQAGLLGGGAPPQTPELEYRVARGPQPAGAWQQVTAADGSVELGVQESLQAPATTTVLALEWRVREPGHVWSDPVGMRFLLVATQPGTPTIQATPSAPWVVGDSWVPGPKREAALRQVHRVELNPPTATARLLYKLGAWQSASPLLSISEANVSSVRSNGLIEQFRSKPTSSDWGADQQPTHCGPDVGPAGLPTLCEYLGPFEVLAGTQVTAFALDVGQLESAAAAITVPRELEPPSGDARFEASVDISGPRVSINSMPGAFVLPSSSDSPFISISPAGIERQSCILASAFTYAAMGSDSGQQAPKQLDDCKWLVYNGKRRMQLNSLLQEAGIGGASSMSLNVTVLTTVRRPGYLWAYPKAVTFLWLRELTPPPSIVGVIEPGPSALVSAMVWLRGEASGTGAGVPRVVGNNPAGADPPRCYFTLRSIPVTAQDLPQHWLAEVPSRTSAVQSVRDAVRPTQAASDAKGIEAWRSDLKACEWPNVCELPLNGTLPAALIQAPAAIPQLCAWALWHGYRASPPACEHMGPKARVKRAQLDFAPGGNVSLQGVGVKEVPVKVGREDRLGNVLVVAWRSSGSGGSWSKVPTSRRLVGGPGSLHSGLPLFLERTHPLQYRYASVPLDTVDIPLGAQHGIDRLLGGAPFSQWTGLDVGDPTPVVPLPSSLQPHQHTLVVVDVRLLIGINRWGQQSRSLCVALTGTHPALSTQLDRRSLSIATLANSTILFRWSLQGPEDIKAVEGALLPMQSNFRSIDLAYALAPSVKSRLFSPGTPFEQCLAPTSHELTDESSGAIGPRLCAVQGPVELRAPDARRWTLWAAAFGPGLELSRVMTQTIDAQCLVPGGISDASSPPCLEGDAIDSGASCTPRCVDGYTPSATSLTCRGGRPDSVTFTCSPAQCVAPTNVTNALALPCIEGQVLASGGHCTTQCAAGYVPTASSLTCMRGRLSPPTFACMEASCAALSNVLHASDPSCSGLKTVASGDACITQCQKGHVPSAPRLTCSKGLLSPLYFTCEEASCTAPSGIRYARAPACSEGETIKPGGKCTPTCQTGYKSSVASLTCSIGSLSPDAFTCVEAISAGGINLAPVIAGLAGGVVVAVFAVFLLCCLRRSNEDEEAQPDEVCELHDALEAWWKCVHEVEPGICVFCGKNPSEHEFQEKDHGPTTIFRCCSECMAVLPIHASPLNLVNGGGGEGGGGGDAASQGSRDTVGTKEAFASDVEKVQEQKPRSSDARVQEPRSDDESVQERPKEADRPQSQRPQLRRQKHVEEVLADPAAAKALFELDPKPAERWEGFDLGQEDEGCSDGAEAERPQSTRPQLRRQKHVEEVLAEEAAAKAERPQSPRPQLRRQKHVEEVLAEEAAAKAHSSQRPQLRRQRHVEELLADPNTPGAEAEWARSAEHRSGESRRSVRWEDESGTEAAENSEHKEASAGLPSRSPTRSASGAQPRNHFDAESGTEITEGSEFVEAAAGPPPRSSGRQAAEPWHRGRQDAESGTEVTEMSDLDPGRQKPPQRTPEAAAGPPPRSVGRQAAEPRHRGRHDAESGTEATEMSELDPGRQKPLQRTREAEARVPPGGPILRRSPEPQHLGRSDVASGTEVTEEAEAAAGPHSPAARRAAEARHRSGQGAESGTEVTEISELDPVRLMRLQRAVEASPILVASDPTSLSARHSGRDSDGGRDSEQHSEWHSEGTEERNGSRQVAYSRSPHKEAMPARNGRYSESEFESDYTEIPQALHDGGRRELRDDGRREPGPSSNSHSHSHVYQHPAGTSSQQHSRQQSSGGQRSWHEDDVVGQRGRDYAASASDASEAPPVRRYSRYSGR